MKRSTKIGMTTAVAVLLVVGVAIAAWLATGSGSGQAKAGQVTIEVNAGTAPDGTGDLYPGVSENGKLYLSVTNTSSVPLTVTKVEPNGSIISVPEACAAYVSFTAQTGLTGPALPVSATAVTFDVPGMSMTADAPTTCQSAIFTVPVTVTASTP